MGGLIMGRICVRAHGGVTAVERRASRGIIPGAPDIKSASRAAIAAAGLVTDTPTVAVRGFTAAWVLPVWR